ncbi:CDP-diacylglycerol--serine O-phosphatidyltransferase [Candidatus Woesearchaeota archaeon]|nr:CDP-diacylglycerol--serine O-phosphatidyltransferase [Candidatus Woesearchaeota archaeon]
MKKASVMLILLRLILSLLAITFLFSQKKDIGAFLFVMTAAISFLDGFLAKRKGLSSQFRSVFDPLADKLLINGTAGALYVTGTLPSWVLGVYLVKDIVFAASGAFLLFKNPKIIFRSNAIDKISAFIQFLALFIILLGRVDTVLLGISSFFVGLSFVATLFRSGVRIVRYRTDLEEIRFSRLIRLPALFTFLNILMGLGSILFVLNGNYFSASIALLLAVLFDVLDGKFARMQHTESDFGKNLDSLADTISFGVAPALFGFSLNSSPLAATIFALFVLAGVLRLARYNIMEFTGTFAGMPITVNGIIIPLIYFAGLPVKLFPYVYLFLALAMVSPVAIKKIF